jgi:hypothetical protein
MRSLGYVPLSCQSGSLGYRALNHAKAYIWMFPPLTPKRLLRRDPVRPAPPSQEEDTGLWGPVTFGVRPTILMTLVISLLGSPAPSTTVGGGIIGQCGTARPIWLDFKWEFYNSESIPQQYNDRVSPLRRHAWFFRPEWKLHLGRASVLHLPQQPAERQQGVLLGLPTY